MKEKSHLLIPDNPESPAGENALCLNLQNRIRTLAMIGNIYFMLLVVTCGCCGVIIYNLYSKSRLLEYENKVLKEMLEFTGTKTNN